MHPRETINRSTSKQNSLRFVQNNSELFESVQKNRNSITYSSNAKKESCPNTEKKEFVCNNRRELSREYRQNGNQTGSISIDHAKVEISNRSNNSTIRNHNNISGSYRKIGGLNI